MYAVIRLTNSNEIPNENISGAELAKQELELMHALSDAFNKFKVTMVTDSDLGSPQGLAELALSDCDDWTEQQVKDRCKSIQIEMLRLRKLRK